MGGKDYATEGLRTLAIAMREIPDEEYKQWSAIYNKAAATINGRAEELDKAAELIETNLFLLGATAIEDKLQDGVPEAIYTLQQAGIKVWVLTGDRQETAINIGLSCRLISESMSLVCHDCIFVSHALSCRLIHACPHRSLSTRRPPTTQNNTSQQSLKPSKHRRVVATWRSLP